MHSEPSSPGRGLRLASIGPDATKHASESTVAHTGRSRRLGVVAPQRRILRGPAARFRGEGPPFVANLEVLDALLATADESLIARMSRLGIRRRQAHRFVVAATGLLLRAAQQQGGGVSQALLETLDVAELARRTRVSHRQASSGLRILLPELAALVVELRR